MSINCTTRRIHNRHAHSYAPLASESVKCVCVCVCVRVCLCVFSVAKHLSKHHITFVPQINIDQLPSTLRTEYNINSYHQVTVYKGQVNTCRFDRVCGPRSIIGKLSGI